MCDGACCGRRDIASQHQPRAGRQLQSGILEPVSGTRAGSCLSRAVAGRDALTHRRCLCRDACQGSRSNAPSIGGWVEEGRGRGEGGSCRRRRRPARESRGLQLPCFWEKEKDRRFCSFPASHARQSQLPPREPRERLHRACLVASSLRTPRRLAGSPGPIDTARRLMCPTVAAIARYPFRNVISQAVLPRCHSKSRMCRELRAR